MLSSLHSVCRPFAPSSLLSIAVWVKKLVTHTPHSPLFKYHTESEIEAMRPTVLIGLVIAATTATAFYIPGMGPVAYEEGGDVKVLVNGLHSAKNIIPYDFYAAPMCRPNVIESRHETIGEILSGENMKSSSYFFHMLADTNCKVSCGMELDDARAAVLQDLIEKEYRAYMVVDNLPAFKNATAIYQGRCTNAIKQMPYQRGFALGVSKACTGGPTLINNHLHFRVQYHHVDKDTVVTIGETDVSDGVIAGQTKSEKKIKKKVTADDDRFLVVGVTVEPFSIKWPNVGDDGTLPTCVVDFDPLDRSIEPLTTAYRGRIAWTYGVTWVEEPNIRWATRWDSYLKTSVADTNNNAHILNILNSILIVSCLVATVFAAIVRALRKDIAQYNMSFELTREEEKELRKDESGWKMVAGDVFRAPKHADILAILAAAGAQVMLMVFTTLACGVSGFLSPARRGAFMTTALMSFVLLSAASGYIAARVLTKLGVEKRWLHIVVTGSILPGCLFVCFVVANALLRSVRSSGSVPFLTLLSLLTLWLLVSVPLALIGATYGYKATPKQNPKKVNVIPRCVNPNLEYILIRMPIVLCLSGILPLSVLFMELRFMMAAMWTGVVYYVFGFLSITVLLWALTVALTSFVVVYYKLCAENYHWWWPAFLAPASCGAHLFLFFTYYFFTSLTISSKIATIIYFIYMTVATFAYTLAAGSIGFFASWMFVIKLYSNLKSD